jgi:hypothetical protein
MEAEQMRILIVLFTLTLDIMSPVKLGVSDGYGQDAYIGIVEILAWCAVQHVSVEEEEDGRGDK